MVDVEDPFDTQVERLNDLAPDASSSLTVFTTRRRINFLLAAASQDDKSVFVWLPWRFV
jgi:hypothetical protein